MRKGGNFDFSRLQAKTCGSCGAASTTIGTSGDWTLVETPSIHVTDGYLEFGLHTRASSGNSANFTHLDGVELYRF